MLTHEEEVQRAQDAANLVNHPLFKESFETLDAELRDAWINSPSNDVEGRESLWLSLKLLAKVRMHLVCVIETGQMAQVKLERRGLKLAR
jgi:hypothetical protein